MTPRTFILMGQGGYLTSQGMVSLSRRIPNSSLHSWSDTEVPYWITTALYSTKVAVIGYSLGANQLGFISRLREIKSETPIHLGIAYDPSWLSPLVKRDSTGRYVQTAPKFKELIVYRNTGAWVWGGSTYTGSNVTEYQTSNFHLGIQSDESLHQITLKKIKDLGQ